MAKQKAEILKWARVGAASRLRELDEERALIVKAFPGLTPGSSSASRAGSKAAAAVPNVRKRRQMSAAARKRISDAQKKRWAAQRSSKK